MHLYAPLPKLNSRVSVAVPDTNRILTYLHGMVRLCEYSHSRLKILSQRRVNGVTGFVCSPDGKHVCITTATASSLLSPLLVSSTEQPRLHRTRHLSSRRVEACGSFWTARRAAARAAPRAAVSARGGLKAGGVGRRIRR